MKNLFFVAFAVLLCPLGEAVGQLEPITIKPFTLQPLTIQPLQPPTPIKPYTYKPYSYKAYSYEPYTYKPYSNQSKQYASPRSTPTYNRNLNVISNDGKYLGKLNSNQYDSDSVSNPYGRHGSKYSSQSVNNPYGRYGSPYSSESANNPYTTRAPKIYDARTGRYRGKLSANRYDSESISNPHSTYGSKYADTVVNPYSSSYAGEEIRSRILQVTPTVNSQSPKTRRALRKKLEDK